MSYQQVLCDAPPGPGEPETVIAIRDDGVEETLLKGGGKGTTCKESGLLLKVHV